MLKTPLYLLLLTTVLATFSGCSSRAWYEGLRNIERQNCQKIAGTAERVECLQREADVSYDQYQRERKDLLQH